MASEKERHPPMKVADDIEVWRKYIVTVAPNPSAAFQGILDEFFGRGGKGDGHDSFEFISDGIVFTVSMSPVESN